MHDCGSARSSSIELTDSDVSRDSEDALAPPPSAVARRGRQTTKASNPGRQAANQRERRRMRSINEAFDFLRKHVPHAHCQKKLSKVDTLRFAVDYIRQLDEMIRQDAEAEAHSSVDPSGSKVFITYEGSAGYAAAATGDGFPPVSGLALSWRSEKQLGLEQLPGGGGGGRTCVAKIWTPANPGRCRSVGVCFDDSADDGGAGDDRCDGFLERIFERSDRHGKLLTGSEHFPPPPPLRSDGLGGGAPAMPTGATACGMALS